MWASALGKQHARQYPTKKPLSKVTLPPHWPRIIPDTKIWMQVVYLASDSGRWGRDTGRVGAYPGCINEQVPTVSNWGSSPMGTSGKLCRTHLGVSQQKKLGIHPQSYLSLVGGRGCSRQCEGWPFQTATGNKGGLRLVVRKPIYTFSEYIGTGSVKKIRASIGNIYITVGSVVVSISNFNIFHLMVHINQLLKVCGTQKIYFCWSDKNRYSFDWFTKTNSNYLLFLLQSDF